MSGGGARARERERERERETAGARAEAEETGGADVWLGASEPSGRRRRAFSNGARAGFHGYWAPASALWSPWPRHVLP